MKTILSLTQKGQKDGLGIAGAAVESAILERYTLPYLIAHGYVEEVDVPVPRDEPAEEIKAPELPAKGKVKKSDMKAPPNDAAMKPEKTA